jgi:hypothetical protein
MKKLSITGTSRGATEYQLEEITSILNLHYSPNIEFHHGNCIGVDFQAANIAKRLGYEVICHPHLDDKIIHDSDQVMVSLPHFVRNRILVNICDMLIVAPFESTPQKLGGTWYTYDYAVKINKPVTLIYPNDL